MAAVEIPTMKSIKTGSEGNGVSSEASEEAAAAPVIEGAPHVPAGAKLY